MYSTLLRPAIKLSRALSYRRKFLLIFLVSVLPGLFLLISAAIDSYADIQRDQAELAGAEYVKTLTPLANAIASHRGATTTYLNGDNSLESVARDSAVEADAVLAKLAAQEKLMHADQWKNKVNAITSNWQQLKVDWRSKSASVNFEAHTRLIALINEYRHHVAGDTGLLLDPQADAYYLIVTMVDQLPQLRERLAQTRGLLASMAAKGVDGSTLGKLDTLLNHDVVSNIDRIDNDIELIEDFHPELSTKVNARWEPTRQVITALREELSKQVLQTGTLGQDASGYFRKISNMLAEMDSFETLMYEQVVHDGLSKRLAYEKKMFVAQISVALTVLLLVGWLIAGFARDLTLRAEALEADMARLSDGDFTALPAVKGNDEMSHIAHSAGKLAAKLGSAMRDIQASARELMAAASNVASISTQVASSTSEQSNAAAAMAAAVEELTVSISHMSGNADDAHRLSTDSGKASSEGGSVINQTVESMEQIAQAVRSASSNVSALGKDAEAISGIVSVIKDIADQTNLLALNAAIEAARAGETGRGFAVVADEVRKLAERTTASTKQIGEMVTRIQQGTQGVVDGMGEGVSKVESGVDLASQAGSAIAQIREGSARVVEVVSEITASLKEQSSVAHEVAGKVETIAQMSEQNTQAAESSAATAEQLRGLAMGLEQKVSTFRFNEA
ncbi:hypothetical protein GCM10007907_36180 [Chitinimonas prasina]|uniref:Methyl-accepting chemotaxis protein n=1 Tax=Chitinimonas prasina TaxID=1434937 RepID=A0ABQ5YMA6_9NEIS|nr:methyl-accepting chemotaxis protein [Chitinimonas prasina]GLR14828.1 hypothetical protein GCM10007907_36180 [Chitinimonas prasina]